MARTESPEERARRVWRSSGYRVHPPKGVSWHRLRYAYHEAGHAVLGHYFGRCIGVVSIDPERVPDLADTPAQGVCLFDFFAEADHHVRKWRPGHRNRNHIAILLGGICAGVYAVDEHGWELLRWDMGAADDLHQIDRFVDALRLSPAKQKRLRWHQEQRAVDLVREYWPAIVEVAQALVDHKTLMGWEVHRLIEPYLVEPSLEPLQTDWRTEPRW